MIGRHVERAWLRLLHRRGGIAAVVPALLRVPRTEEMLREYGATIGADTVLHGPLVIHNAELDFANLTIGAGVHLGPLCIIDLAAPVTIGDRATVSMGTTILTHADVGQSSLQTELPRQVAAAELGPDCYLGANVTVLAGCRVGARAIVAAGAVVTSAVPDDARVGGVPAAPLTAS